MSALLMNRGCFTRVSPQTTRPIQLISKRRIRSNRGLHPTRLNGYTSSPQGKETPAKLACWHGTGSEALSSYLRGMRPSVIVFQFLVHIVLRTKFR